MPWRGSTPCQLVLIDGAMDGSHSPQSAPLRLCQTLTQAGLAHLYTPRHANDAAYECDLGFFARHKSPKRRLSFRQTMGPEFGTRYEVISPPPLWVLVNEASPGFHLALPVWRGFAFFRVCSFRYGSFANVTSDAEVAAILDECFRRGGFDQEAISRWEAQVREAGERPPPPVGPSWGR
jgi:hypothetical protein